MRKKIEEIINREDTCEQAFPCHYKKDSIDQLLQLFKDSVRRIIGKDEKMMWTAEFMEQGKNELRAKQRLTLEKEMGGKK